MCNICLLCGLFVHVFACLWWWCPKTINYLRSLTHLDVDIPSLNIMIVGSFTGILCDKVNTRCSCVFTDANRCSTNVCLVAAVTISSTVL